MTLSHNGLLFLGHPVQCIDHTFIALTLFDNAVSCLYIC